MHAWDRGPPISLYIFLCIYILYIILFYYIIHILYSLSFNILGYLLHKNCIVSTSIFLQIDSDWSLVPWDKLSLGMKIDWKAKITVDDKICTKKTNLNFFEFLWGYFYFISVRGNYSAKKFCWKFTLDIQYLNDYLFYFYPFSIFFSRTKISFWINIFKKLEWTVWISFYWQARSKSQSPNYVLRPNSPLSELSPCEALF